jgi:hypothetical protein
MLTKEQESGFQFTINTNWSHLDQPSSPKADFVIFSLFKPSKLSVTKCSSLRLKIN